MSVIIGAVSSHYDPDFTRNFLGNDYVDTTIRNIENGDPMGVYKTQEEGEMWLHIMSNNIKVSFISVIFGFIIFTSYKTYAFCVVVFGFLHFVLTVQNSIDNIFTR